jgi:hypothetical protein
MLIVLFVVLVVESFFELFITIRAASCFSRLSSIRRCPSGSSRSPGASSVFIVLMVGSMIVISLAFEGSRVNLALPQRPQQESRRVQRLHRPHGRQHDRHQPGLRGQSRRFGAAPAAATGVQARPASSSSSWSAVISGSGVFASVGALIVPFVVLVVESFYFELFITIRAASCLTSSVFIVLMVGSMIVISLAFEGSRFARRKPSWFSRNRRRQQRL